MAPGGDRGADAGRGSQMIHEYTNLRMADNAGARTARCIRVLGGTRKRYATVGDIIIVAVHDVIPNGPLQEGQVAKAVVARTTKEYRRPDGLYIRFQTTTRRSWSMTTSGYPVDASLTSRAAVSPSRRVSAADQLRLYVVGPTVAACSIRR